MSHLQGTTKHPMMSFHERYAALRQPCPPNCAHCAVSTAAEIAVAQHVEACEHCAMICAMNHPPTELCPIGFELAIRCSAGGAK